MNNFVILSVVVPFVLFLLCVIPSLLLAQRKNAQLFRRLPHAMPYTWGYFLGYSGIIGGVLMIVVTVVVIIAGFYQDWFLIGLAYIAALGLASYGVLTRKKWGWLFHIPLTLNPALWAFNSVYLGNRWREF